MLSIRSCACEEAETGTIEVWIQTNTTSLNAAQLLWLQKRRRMLEKILRALMISAMALFYWPVKKALWYACWRLCACRAHTHARQRGQSFNGRILESEVKCWCSLKPNSCHIQFLEAIRHLLSSGTVAKKRQKHVITLLSQCDIMSSQSQHLF